MMDDSFASSARAVQRDEAPWTRIPTRLLLAELQIRQDKGDTPKPACGSRGRGSYDTAAHIFALFLILALSTLSCGFPLFSRRTTGGQLQKTIIFYCQHVGTGVLLATAFVHLLPTAFQSLNDPCLPDFFSKIYTPLPGFIAMVSAIIVVGVESYLTARGAGHSHSHSHGLWGDEDEDDHAAHVPLHGMSGLSRRRPSAPQLDDIDVDADDREATQGLVAGVSPAPQSTPTIGGPVKNSGEHEFHDGDSDLELDPAELQQQAPVESGEPDGHTPATIATQSPDDHQKQILQCVLLEAGILFHSVFIGMAVSVATGPAFVVFLIAICFHQSFEGLALGSRIAAIQFPKASLRPWLMVLAYGITTPVGQAIGLAVHKMYDPQSMGGLLVVGFMNAVSSGLLLYAGLVQLLAADFLSDNSYKTLKGQRRLRAYIAVAVGAMMMAIVGAVA